MTSALSSGWNSESALASKDFREKGVDFLFRCNNCIKVIPDAAPIYMRHDSSYCSTGCREKGVSGLYTNLVGQQLRMLHERERSMHSVKSDSSIQSKASEYSDMQSGQNKALPFRLLAKAGNMIMNKIIPTVASNQAGEKLLRTYSSGLVWGKEYTRNSSFNFMFQYFPDIDYYMDEDENIHPSESDLQSAAHDTKSIKSQQSNNSSEGQKDQRDPKAPSSQYNELSDKNPPKSPSGMTKVFEKEGDCIIPGGRQGGSGVALTAYYTADKDKIENSASSSSPSGTQQNNNKSDISTKDISTANVTNASTADASSSSRANPSNMLLEGEHNHSKQTSEVKSNNSTKNIDNSSSASAASAANIMGASLPVYSDNSMLNSTENSSQRLIKRDSTSALRSDNAISGMSSPLTGEEQEYGDIGPVGGPFGETDEIKDDDDDEEENADDLPFGVENGDGLNYGGFTMFGGVRVDSELDFGNQR